MVDVLEELTAERTPSRADVERRLDDWERRIRDLYATLEAWLPTGWTADVERHTTYLSELMREVGVPARELPVLRLWDESGPHGLIEPRYLWIIGANGRLDAAVGSARFQLVDRADNFAPPRWQIVSFDSSAVSAPLDQHAFLSALERGR